jgi:hypothetical protein
MPTDGSGMFARIWVIKSDLFFYQLLIVNKLIFGTQGNRTYVLVSRILIVYQHTRIYSLILIVEQK